MRQSSFKKMFSVAVFHSYFENDKCNHIQFSPTNECKGVMMKFGFLINRKSNGFELFSNTTGSIRTLLEYIHKTSGTDYLEFDINTDNPDFTLFTEIPINWLGQITYNSRDPENQHQNGNTQLHEILKDGESSSIGNLKIYFEDIWDYNDNPDYTCFEMNFRARATQWQYYIINKNTPQFDNLTIKEKENITFDGPEQVVLETGEQALLFSSGATLIPLSEKPKYKFDLVNNTTANELNQKTAGHKIVIKGLPVPNVARIGKDKTQVSSPMYIYL